LLRNCAEAILAKSGERNGAHADELAVGVAPSCGLTSSADAVIAAALSTGGLVCGSEVAPTARRPRRRASALVARRGSKPSMDGYSAGGHRVGTVLHLVGSHVLDVSGDIPSVTKGILESPGAIAIELVLDRA